MLDGPGPDELAADRRYNEDDPAAVADALAANAERLAATVEAVPADGWDRAGVRRGEERSVASPPAGPCTRAATTCSTSAAACGPYGGEPASEGGAS